MDKDLEIILNLTPEERDKRNKRMDSKLLIDRAKFKRGKACQIIVPKAMTEGERAEQERFRRCADLNAKNNRSWGWKRRRAD
jgi:hypothetical protein